MYSYKITLLWSTCAFLQNRRARLNWLLWSLNPIVNKKLWITASAVKVGDLLTTGGSDASLVKVTRIDHTTHKGLFAPFTKSGSIVVNDFIASTYVAIQPVSKEYLAVGGLKTPFSFHWLSHSFEGGHHLAFHFLVDCLSESYTELGVSRWVLTRLTKLYFGRWSSTQSLWLHSWSQPLSQFRSFRLSSSKSWHWWLHVFLLLLSLTSLSWKDKESRTALLNNWRNTIHAVIW